MNRQNQCWFQRFAGILAMISLLLAGGCCAFAAEPPASNGISLELPKPGDHSLRILAPSTLELERVNSKQPDPARVDCWDFLNEAGIARLPEPGQFVVTVNGRKSEVKAVGFKRRVLYAPVARRDLRIGNWLYLQLTRPVSTGDCVEVSNPDGALWPDSMKFVAAADALRLSPAIHVNQEGYVPAFSKKAMVGFYQGSLGEMEAPAVSGSSGFKLVDAGTGEEVFHGPLVPRRDKGYVYLPTPYQNVLEADFTSFVTPGTYRLAVPGLGASLPFVIDDGIAMNFVRAYALGLYHQRCGTSNALPFTRQIHDACHTAAAEVPVPESAFAAAWANIRSNNADIAKNPRHTAPRLVDEKSQLYPFLRTEKLDVSGGHHDAGDYSKYTINSAQLIHALIFAVDAFPGVAAVDNLGIPESGDGIGDLMQEARWEADFLVKMQDSDGGFYFLVYPRNRKYENNVPPERGDSQIVWPKNTAATAAAVAALAQTASSPGFKSHYPQEVERYLYAANKGWDFLLTAIAAHGKDGAYQKLTHYGDVFMHDDELAWAACEMYLATGRPECQQRLKEWYDPASRETRRWSWWGLFEGYGCAARSYAFAVKTGRVPAQRLAPDYLAKCTAEVIAAGDDALSRSSDNAYGTAFDSESKRVRAAGWYFSSDRAFDVAVAFQLEPKPAFLDAILTNLNYEAGCNPVNAVYITGLGSKRQREIVNQFAQNNRRALPPSGIPIGNMQGGFAYLGPYKRELGALTFPPDGTEVAPYPFYDRWGDSFNTATEPVVVNQARSLASLAFLATRTPRKEQPWQAVGSMIEISGPLPAKNKPVSVGLKAGGLDLRKARIVWEAQGHEPVFGAASWTFIPSVEGPTWVEAEAQWPDGRRAFSATLISPASP